MRRVISIKQVLLAFSHGQKARAFCPFPRPL
jgi:hypothetical protein